MRGKTVRTLLDQRLARMRQENQEKREGYPHGYTDHRFQSVSFQRWLSLPLIARESTLLNLKPLLQEYQVQSRCENLVKNDAFYRDGIIPDPIYSQILTFSDLHGDFDELLDLLVNVGQVIQIHKPVEKKKTSSLKRKRPRDSAELKEEKEEEEKKKLSVEWIGGATAIVVVGDFVDRFRNSPSHRNSKLKMNVTSGEFLNEEESILDFLNLVHVLALPHGGRVFKVMGNHDLQYLWGAIRYASPMNRTRFPIRSAAFGPGGALNRRYQTCGIYGVLQIYNLFFVHGGLISSPINNSVQLQDLLSLNNHDTRDLFEHPVEMKKRVFAGSREVKEEKEEKKEKERDRLQAFFLKSGDKSPFWTRAYHRDENSACQLWNNMFPFWSRKRREKKKKLTCPYLSSRDEKSEKSEKNDLCLPPVLITGHTPMVGALEGRESVSNMNYFLTQVDEDKKRVVYNGETCTIQSHDLEKGAESERFPHTIRYFCCGKSDTPAIWMVDASGSRAFDDKSTYEEYQENSLTHTRLWYRRPQLLRFQWDKLTEEYIPSVLVSKRLLPRYRNKDTNLKFRL